MIVNKNRICILHFEIYGRSTLSEFKVPITRLTSETVKFCHSNLSSLHPLGITGKKLAFGSSRLTGQFIFGASINYVDEKGEGGCPNVNDTT